MNIKFEFVLISVIFIATNSTIVAMAQVIDTANPNSMTDKKNNLSIIYADNTAQGYQILVDSSQRYTISQSFSWVRDQTSRYNLVSYSIDDADPVSISRLARGNFTLDMTMDVPHSVIFFAAQQYPIDISDGADVIFSPPSPTGDNWFDVDSEVTVMTPNLIENKQGKEKKQLVGWSLDGSNVKTLQRKDSGMFSTQAIAITSAHTIDLVYASQYYLELDSLYGKTEGEGWYDAGNTITISVDPPNEFLVRHIFTGWEGPIEKATDSSASVLVDSPKIIVARWATDYSQLIVMVVILAGVGVIIAIRKRRTKPSLASMALIETTNNDVKQEYDANYTSKIADYAKQKSIEKLDSIRDSGLISDSRYAIIKEKLEAEK